jgi:hypothetical protein
VYAHCCWFSDRFLTPTDFPFGCINPWIGANAPLAEPHLAGFERLKASSALS